MEISRRAEPRGRQIVRADWSVGGLGGGGIDRCPETRARGLAHIGEVAAVRGLPSAQRALGSSSESSEQPARHSGYGSAKLNPSPRAEVVADKDGTGACRGGKAPMRSGVVSGSVVGGMIFACIYRERGGIAKTESRSFPGYGAVGRMQVLPTPGGLSEPVSPPQW